MYKRQEYALSRGIIIADTKFEFGLDENGNVILGDEMLTPDSSRFWPLEGYEAGHGQPSFDKQFVRNWLKANPDSNYDLPQDVIEKTIATSTSHHGMMETAPPLPKLSPSDARRFATIGTLFNR